MEEKFRVIIAGGRDFEDFRYLCKVCMHMLQNKSEVVVVSGTANGADKLGEKFAKFMGYEIKEFPANWEEMINYSDASIIFWDKNDGETKKFIELVEKSNLKNKVYYYNNDDKIENKSEWWE